MSEPSHFLLISTESCTCAVPMWYCDVSGFIVLCERSKTLGLSMDFFDASGKPSFCVKHWCSIIYAPFLIILVPMSLRWPALQCLWIWTACRCPQSSCHATTRMVSSLSSTHAASTSLVTSLRLVEDSYFIKTIVVLSSVLHFMRGKIVLSLQHHIHKLLT